MLSKSDYKYFAKARQIADVSDFHNIHVGCVAVYQGSIIGIGCNANKTHPLQDYYNQYRRNNQQNEFVAKLHAEISCISSIRQMDINFAKVKLYIYRQRCDQEYGLARPCPSCMAAIRDLGVRHIYYTTDTGFAYERIRENTVA